MLLPLRETSVWVRLSITIITRKHGRGEAAKGGMKTLRTLIYLCACGHHFQQIVHQPGAVDNLTCVSWKRGHDFPPYPVGNVIIGERG